MNKFLWMADALTKPILPNLHKWQANVSCDRLCQTLAKTIRTTTVPARDGCHHRIGDRQVLRDERRNLGSRGIHQPRMLRGLFSLDRRDLGLALLDTPGPDRQVTDVVARAQRRPLH